jgi:hypothetical protein
MLSVGELSRVVLHDSRDVVMTDTPPLHTSDSHTIRAPLSPGQWLALVTLGIALVIFWSSRITGTVIKEDAGENLRMALNLKHVGVMSHSEQPPFRPSMFREPLPVISTLVTLYVIEAVIGPAPDSQYFQGERAKWVKAQNLFWLGGLCVAVFAYTRRLTPSFNTALAAVLIVNFLLLGPQTGMYMLDSLYTEAPAAMLLTVSSLVLAAAVLRRSVVLTITAGICFGLLALVKAAFLYVTAGIVVALPFAALLNRKHYSVKALARLAAVLGVTAFAMVAPWMYRNYAELGTFGITSRGGEALYYRAVEDQMTVQEYVGSFALWAPYPLNGLLRRMLRISREDLANGVRLQRLGESRTSKWWAADLAAEVAGQPDKTYTFHRRVGAVREQLLHRYTAGGRPDPYLAADHELGRQGLQIIRAHPLRHLALTVSNLWRGAFFTMPLVLIALIQAWRTGNVGLAMLTLPTFGMVTFYGLFAVFIERYGLPAYPIGVCLAVALCARLWHARHRFKRSLWLSNAFGP